MRSPVLTVDTPTGPVRWVRDQHDHTTDDGLARWVWENETAKERPE